MEIRAEGVKKGENNLNKKDGMNIIWIYIYLYFRVQEKSLKKDQLWNPPPLKSSMKNILLLMFFRQLIINHIRDIFWNLSKSYKY